tara:strand:+ start:5474 stop:6151 length:678 start_codon:yes stop_codon:yes gene_type:complete
MAEEQVQESMAPETTSSNEVDALKAEREALLKKNYELIGKLKNAKTVPDGVDVQELLDFKAAAEQADLEKQGKYTEARQALEQQFREAAEEKDKRIAELEARVRELEILSPAATALRDVVHDPDMILNTQVVKEQIQREADGTVVVVNGYERTPIADWAKSLPAWMQKQPKPQGSGAPAGRSTGGDIPPGTNNPFAKDSFNLTEQSRLFRTDRDMYERLKAAAER